MKIVKTLLFAIVATCFFASANAQVRINARIGHPVHRPARRVVVVHHPVHHHHRHVVVRRHY
jgi:hypothetical protein